MGTQISVIRGLAAKITKTLVSTRACSAKYRSAYGEDPVADQSRALDRAILGNWSVEKILEQAELKFLSSDQSLIQLRFPEVKTGDQVPAWEF